MKRLVLPSWRTLVLRLLGRLHCALIAAVFFAVGVELLGYFLKTAEVADASALVGAWTGCSGPVEAYLRALLLAAPLALSDYAVRRLPKMWQYLAASLFLCALAWLLAGNAVAAVLAALVCFLRARKRLAEETDRSALDVPSWWCLPAFAAAFAITAAFGLSASQRLVLLSAVLYFLVCLAFHGLDRIDGYLNLNRGMHGLPARRIQYSAGIALAAAVLLAGVLLLPAALDFTGEVTFDLYQDASGPDEAQLAAEAVFAEAAGQPSFEGLLPADFLEEVHVPAFVNYIAYVLAVGLAAFLTVFITYRLIRSFRFSFRDGRDKAEFLPETAREERGSTKHRSGPPARWDRSPNARVRRYYRKAVLRASQEPPEKWRSPQEIESAAGLSAPALHALYEKARYGSVPCTPEEARSLKEKT